MCIIACPFGGPSIDPFDRSTVKCDLCDGDPECVKFCPNEALKFIPADKMGATQKRVGLEKLFKAINTMI